jgi:putative methionine-R-sulfoxide reductase with GAF domain
MDGFLRAIIERLPEWSFHVFAAVIAVGIAMYFYKTFFLQKKFNELVRDVLKRDDRIKEYQEKIDRLGEEKARKEAVASQLTSTISNVTPFIEALNNLRKMRNAQITYVESANLLQRLLDVLALDIKSVSGERHRCGIWFKDDHMLTLQFASAGFPNSYIGNRRLDINRSIAGRSLRKQMTIYCPDVTKDEDWERNNDSKSPYKSLICIPIGDWSVLTIDGLEPMREECKMIGELYATIVGGIMDIYMEAFIDQHRHISQRSGAMENEEEVG